MTGALIAFAVLGVQLLIQIRSQRDANAREDQADRAALLLQLGRSSNLSDLDLQGKDLSTAYLKEKDLSGANLSRSSMSRASLQGTKLVGANLSGASLDKAQLQRADLRYAALDGASLVEANLSGANLDAATLTPGVDLTRADLSNASARADLRLAVLVDANLVGAQLDRANLQGANFTGADLQFADLRGADLRGANLLKVEDLDLARDLSRATYDRDTQWPATFYWPPEAIRPTRPRCSKPKCELQDSPSELNTLPQGLIAMREKLERAVNDAECLPGWLVEDQPGRIEAHAPRGGATFSILTEHLPPQAAPAAAAAGPRERGPPPRSSTVPSPFDPSQPTDRRGGSTRCGRRTSRARSPSRPSMSGSFAGRPRDSMRGPKHRLERSRFSSVTSLNSLLPWV